MKVTKQHYVPQFYLKQWTFDSHSRQVYVFNKDNSKSYKANIKDVAYSKYFYDFPTFYKEQKSGFLDQLNNDKTLSDKEREDLILLIDKEQIVENALGNLEYQTAPIIKDIIHKLNGFSALPIAYFKKHKIFTIEQIIDLSYFIAMQYARTEESRITLEQITQKIAKYHSDFILDNIDKLQNNTKLKKHIGEEKFNSLYDSVKSGKFTKDSFTIEVDQTYKKLQHLASMFESAKHIANILKYYKWVILVNNTDIPFYTSDSPVIKKANLYGPLSNGFKSKGIEIVFPISPKYAIIIIEPSYLYERTPSLLDYTILNCSKENMIYYNDLLVQQATSQIYSNQNNFNIVIRRIEQTPEVSKKYRKRLHS